MKNPSTQTEKSFEEMLNDCSIDATMAIDTDRNIVAWNNAAEQSHNKTKDEVLGKALLEVIPSVGNDEETMQAIQTAFKGVKSFVPASKKYFHRVHAENHYIPLFDSDKKLIGVMNIVHDVAHRIKAEEQLQYLNSQLERRFRQLKSTSEELASFTYITVNKLKDPIRQIYTGIEHLIKIEATRLTDSGKASFRRMQSSLNRMDLLLNDIISLSQISALEPLDDEVDINTLLIDVKDLLKNKIQEKNAEIITGDLCVVHGHKKQLSLLFYHLLDNAIKFNESNQPVITITCEKKHIRTDINSSAGDKIFHKIAIADNGIGFEKAEQDRIFKMFEKLHEKKYKGSGVGLAIVRKIMEVHDGFIELESEPGKGSTFCCYFPVKDDVTINNKFSNAY